MIQEGCCVYVKLMERLALVYKIEVCGNEYLVYARFANGSTYTCQVATLNSRHCEYFKVVACRPQGDTNNG
jgi:hypothetical protein